LGGDLAKRRSSAARAFRIRSATMNAEQWLEAYASKLGIAPPTDDELETLLALAGVAAHSSERKAAPIACWLAARAGVDPEQAIRLAQELSDG
jgi:hypothetical protein